MQLTFSIRWGCLLAALFFELFVVANVSIAQAQNHPFSETITLDDIRRLVNSQNRTIRDRHLRASSADASVYSETLAFDWKTSPFISASRSSDGQVISAGLVLSQRLSNNIQLSTGPVVSELDGNYTTGAEASVTIPLLKGFGKLTGEDQLNLAKHQYRIEELEVLHTIRTKLTEAIEIAYEVQRQIHVVEEQRRYQNTLKKQVRATIAKVRAELATQIDVYRAEIALNNAKTALNSAQQQLVDARDRLNRILALDGSVELTLVLPSHYELPALSIAELSKRAIASSYTLAQEKARVSESRRKVAVAKANVKPKLDVILTAGIAGQGQSITTGAGPGEEYFTIALQSDFEIGQRKERTNLQQARISKRQQEIVLADEKEQVVVRARKSWRELISQKEKRGVAEDQMSEARSKRALAILRFTHGLATNFDVIEAEREVNTATLEHTRASASYMVEVYRFMASIGALQTTLPFNEDRYVQTQ